MAMSGCREEADQTCLSLFTSNHSNHDSTWMAKGSAFKIVCIACLIETLEDKEVLAIRKRKILSEMLVLVSRDEKLVSILSTNLRICSHLCVILVNLLEINNEALIDMAIEGLVQLACKLRSEQIVREIVENTEKKIFGLNNLRKACPYISLVGKIVNTIAPLAEELVVQKPRLLEYCVSNLFFPEEKTRLSLMYLVIGVCQNSSAKSKLSNESRTVIFKSCCESLADANSTAICMNSLALLQSFANPEDLKALDLLDGDRDGKEKRALMAKALKKVILNTDESVQIGGIQCMTKFLSLDSPECILTTALLQSGVAEFLFEGLETNNDVVLASLFCCLSGFFNSTEFFKGSYSVYGIESVVSGMYKALKLQNPETIQQALHVLSNVITKQPCGVPLFSNGSLFERCLNAIEECFKSMDYNVLQEAIYVVGSIFRVDQLPSGFNVERMLAPLSAVISLLKTFTSKNVDNFNGMNAAKAQEFLHSLLAVVNKATAFVHEYRDKFPSLEEALLDDTSNINPSNKEKSIIAVKEFLMRGVDEFCIAAVMMNYDAITNPMVFEVLLRLINSQLSSPSDSQVQLFAKKLAAASFIRISIDINGKFCKDGCQKSLLEALQQFLRKLMLCLTDAFEREQVIGILESAVIPSSPDECLTLLTQSSMDSISSRVSDEMLFKIQCFCVELLYFAYVYQDFILPELLLLRGLHKYICLHRNLGLLPRMTFRHIVFLYGSITMKLKAILLPRDSKNLIESQDILVGALLKLQDEEFLKVSSNDASFFLWVFSIDALGKAFGRIILERLLGEEEDEKQECQMMLLGVLRDNQTALRSLLSLALCENAKVVKKALGVIEKALALEQGNHQEDLTSITQIIIEELQRLFLRNRVTPFPEQILQTMMRILIPIQVATAPEVNIKLLYFVIEILTKPTSGFPCTTVIAINYLNVALCVNMESPQPRVAAVLFSNKGFISWLQKAMTSLTSQDPRKSKGEFVNVFAACLLLVSNLLLSESKLRIVHTFHLKVGKDVLTELLNSNQSCVLRLAGLVFWKAHFKSKGKTFVLFEDKILGQESVDGENTLTELDLKVIFVYLQNCLMNESEAVKSCSMECMKAFLSFADCNDAYKSNRWNTVILGSLLFSTGSEKLDPNLVQMCTMMLKIHGLDKDIGGVLSQAVKTIQQQIPKMELDLDDAAPSKVASSCIEFLHQVLSVDPSGLSSLDTDELLAWCKNLDVSRTRNETKHFKFINVEQVIFTKVSVMGQVKQDAPLIGEVIKKLEKKIPVKTLMSV